MGFGSIFATIACVVIIGFISYSFTTGTLFSMNTLSTSLTEMTEIDNAQLKTEIEIVNATVSPSRKTISVKINNTGSTKILNSQFKNIDIFVYYKATGFGYITTWISYNDTESSALQNNEWRVVRISPDLINPRIFDPDEQMEIKLEVDPKIEHNSINWIKVVMPNGISDSKHFQF